MQLANVKLILAREVRDQLRDRRTLFVIAVLPLVLYPLLGMSFFQVSQFMREQPTSVLVLGARPLTDFPPLFLNSHFSNRLTTKPGMSRLLQLQFTPTEPRDQSQDIPNSRNDVLKWIREGKYDAVLYFPDDFAEQLERFRAAVEQHSDTTSLAPISDSLPCPEIICTTASEKSQLAFNRLHGVLKNWRERVARSYLQAGGVPVSAARPFEVQMADVAEDTSHKGAAVWSKVLPLILLVWALTGAFYPAVDLCAGEKERGTMETLLSSPAQRSEIVLGKLLTIMLFSMATALLNLLSIALTGWLLFGNMIGFTPPPPIVAVWLLLALVPVAALFSALCLALAAFARSTKEGQYYLMPLLLITLPLALLPMAPGVEMNLGNALIPITGIVLLLRGLLEGHYASVLQFTPVVIAVTLGSCLLAIRWAVDQFNSESALFRESERLDIRLWFKYLLRDRKPTPTIGAALTCGFLIVTIRFLLSATMPTGDGFSGFALSVLIIQLAVIAAPALIMTFILTRRPRQTLLIAKPPGGSIFMAVLLALSLHPVVAAMQEVVTHLYPIAEQLHGRLEEMQQMLLGAPLWQLLLLIAVLPPICEELAFRGFVLSGLRHMGRKWRAIVISALLFGFAHAVLQQSLLAALVGVVIGYLAVQTGSILPCMAFHMVHNSLPILVMRIPTGAIESWPVLGTILNPIEGGYAYPWQIVALGACSAAMLLLWFAKLRWMKTPEEQLHETIQRGLHEDDDFDIIRALP